MDQANTVESRVLEILKECPKSRYDDMILVLHYYNRFGCMRIGKLPFEDIVLNYKSYGYLALKVSEEQDSVCSLCSLSCHVIQSRKGRIIFPLLLTFREERFRNGKKQYK